MEHQTFTFAASQFVPVAIGFFGLGTGYFIWGGPALFGFPRPSSDVDKTMGMWGFWMPGFMQFITGFSPGSTCSEMRPPYRVSHPEHSGIIFVGLTVFLAGGLGSASAVLELLGFLILATQFIGIVASTVETTIAVLIEARDRYVE